MQRSNRKGKAARQSKPGNLYFACSYRWHICELCQEDILPGQQYRRCGKKKLHHNPRCAEALAQSSRPARYTAAEWQATLYGSSSERRIIWSRQFQAKETYDCDYCSCWRSYRTEHLAMIYPGDRYIREVWLIDGKIKIKRMHDFCPSDLPDFDEDEDQMSDDQPRCSDNLVTMPAAFVLPKAA